MASPHLPNDEFLAKLGQLFDYRKTRDHGGIYLTQKRLTHGQGIPEPTKEEPMPDLHPAQALPLIVHATNGKGKRDKSSKVKLSTVVQPNDLEAFFSRYADICKAGMTTLKPRDRSRKKEKAKARKKKAGGAA